MPENNRGGSSKLGGFGGLHHCRRRLRRLCAREQAERGWPQQGSASGGGRRRPAAQKPGAVFVNLMIRDLSAMRTQTLKDPSGSMRRSPIEHGRTRACVAARQGRPRAPRPARRLRRLAPGAARGQVGMMCSPISAAPSIRNAAAMRGGRSAQRRSDGRPRFLDGDPHASRRVFRDVRISTARNRKASPGIS